MNENIELIEYVYKDSEMCVYSLTKLLNELNGKENKIKKLVEEELKESKKYLKECKKIIKKNNYEPKCTGTMSKMSAGMGIKMEVIKDNSDAAIAHMLIQGMTMGLVDITTKIKNYEKSVEKEILEIAQKYKEYEETEIEKLKKFL